MVNYGGIAEIEIDGESQGTVDTYKPFEGRGTRMVFTKKIRNGKSYACS